MNLKPPPVNLTNWPLWVAFCREAHEQLMESILATEDEEHDVKERTTDLAQQ